MLFNSPVFLFVFLPIVYFTFWRLKTKPQRYVWLILASYVFYSFWNYKFCALMLFSTVVAYVAGIGVAQLKKEQHRKWCLAIAVTVDLLLLGFFKYFNFFLDNLNDIAAVFHHSSSLSYFEIVLPVGISFYTFHTISYIADVYSRRVKPTYDFFKFSLYVSLFSQLVAGPIVRYWQIDSDLDKIADSKNIEGIRKGWSFFAIGMIEKVLIADGLAAMVVPALNGSESLSTPWAWLCSIGFAYMYYFDFAGYSDMAVGLGYLFGFHIPQNFNSPFKSTDMTDFFRRWHISLTMCLRDLIYIPLGGNGKGAWISARNVLIVTFLVGLWHGPKWTYILVFVFMGIVLVVQRFAHPQLKKLPKLMLQSLNFCVIIVAFAMFSAPNVPAGLNLLGRMFSWSNGSPVAGGTVLIPMIALAAWFAHVAPNSFEVSHHWRPLSGLIIRTAFLAAVVLAISGSSSKFLYFQF